MRARSKKNKNLYGSLYSNTDPLPASASSLCRWLTCGSAWRHFFLTTSTSVDPRAPAGQPASLKTGHCAYLAGTGHQKALHGLDRPKSPRAARAPAGLLRFLTTGGDKEGRGNLRMLEILLAAALGMDEEAGMGDEAGMGEEIGTDDWEGQHRQAGVHNVFILLVSYLPDRFNHYSRYPLLSLFTTLSAPINI